MSFSSKSYAMKDVCWIKNSWILIGFFDLYMAPFWHTNSTHGAFLTPHFLYRPPPTHQNVESSTSPTHLFNFSPPFSFLSHFFQPQRNLLLSVTEMQTRRCRNTTISTCFTLFQNKSLSTSHHWHIKQIESMSKKLFRKFLLPFFTSDVIY